MVAFTGSGVVVALTGSSVVVALTGSGVITAVVIGSGALTSSGIKVTNLNKAWLAIAYLADSLLLPFKVIQQPSLFKVWRTFSWHTTRGWTLFRLTSKKLYFPLLVEGDFKIINL